MSDRNSLIYPEDGSSSFRWYAGLHLPNYTASHPKLVIFRTTYFSQLLPQFLASAFYCNPQAAFFCNLLSFHFQNMAIAGVCWRRGIRKRERLLFYEKKASFHISRFDSFSLLRQQRDRTWSISLSEPSQQSQHRNFLPLSPSITPETHPQAQNLRSSSPYISSLGLVREVTL